MTPNPGPNSGPALPVALPAVAGPRVPARWIAAVLVVALAPVLTITGLFWKVDLFSNPPLKSSFAISPGPAEEVGKLIHVPGPQYSSKGAFLLTTVSVTTDTINLFESIRAWFDPAIETIPRSALIAPGLSDEEQDQINQADMEESKYYAEIVALQAAGLPVTPLLGARVIKVLSTKPAAGILQEGDVITKVAGVAIASSDELRNQIGKHAVGDRLAFEILRDGHLRTVTVKTVGEPADQGHVQPVIGVIVAPAYRLPISVTIDSQDIVGPSAGLMFSLSLADALTPDDLTAGHRIAGTGTIDLFGTVGPIGGVEQKVRAAEYAGAEIFLSPVEDYPAAKKTARHIKVYSVKTFKDALKLLEGLTPKRAN